MDAPASLGDDSHLQDTSFRLPMSPLLSLSGRLQSYHVPLVLELASLQNTSSLLHLL
jgi:hypothetical protein